MQRTHTLIFALLVLIALPGFPQGPDTATSGQQNTPTYRTSARLVVVDVVATDSKGTFVRGLTSDDFIILEDGVKVPLLKFSLEAELQHAAEAPAEQETRLDSTNEGIIHEKAVTKRSNIVATTARSTLNVVLLDRLNCDIADQATGTSQLLRLLKLLPPGKQLAVLVLADRLRILQGLTGNSSDVISAVEQALPGKSTSLTTASEVNRQENDLRREVQLGTPPQIVQRLRQIIAEENSRMLDDRVSATLDALSQIASLVAGYPGRKNLIWLSSAFPLSVDPDSRLLRPEAVRRDYSRSVRRVTTLLATSQVAVYPVDVRGLLPSFHDTMFSGAPEPHGSEIERNQQMIVDPMSTMKEMADQTGGKAFYNVNDLTAAVGQSLALGSQYYSLAYSPRTSRPDGKFHRIEVKLANKAAALAYRRGYYALPDDEVRPAKEVESSVVRVMQPGSLGSTALALDATVDRTRGKISIRYLVRPGEVTTRDVRGNKCDLLIDFFAIGWNKVGQSTGRVVESVRIPADSLSIENIEKAGFVKSLELDVKPNTSLVRVGVMDRHSGRVGTVDF